MKSQPFKSKFFSFAKSYGWLAVTSGLLLAALLVMSQILRSTPEFIEYYVGLLIFSISGILVLLALLVRTVFKLYRQYKLKVTGIKTTIRITSTLMMLLAFPIIILFYFSLSLIHQSIDQWFDVGTEQALSDASALVRTNLDFTTRDSLNKTLRAEQNMRHFLTQMPAFAVNELREQLDAKEVSLYQSNGQLVAYSHAFGLDILPIKPSHNLFQQVRQRHNYAAIETDSSKDQTIIRVIIPVTDPFLNQIYPLQVIFALPENITRYAQSVRLAESQYHELSYLRNPLKTSFSLILSMVLLLTLVSALLFTIQAAQNLTRPIRHLALGTQRVAQGDYSTKMQVDRDDEFGTLIQSFNDMIQQVAKARNDIKINHQQTEVQRLYFQAVIRNLTNGVVTLDMNRRVRTVNDKASQILGVPLQPLVGEIFSSLVTQENNPHLKPFFEAVTPHFEIKNQGKIDPKPWSAQISLQSNNQQRIILMHGSTLPSIDQKVGGFVLVLDDITELVQAQLHAAWSDVARRLAHEIKNPLTPIQLSAERLQLKLASKLEEADSQLLERMTRTIVDQVDTMQLLVQAFIDYAHTPEMQLQLLDLNELILDLVSLYQTPNEPGQLTTQLDYNCPYVLADRSRFRQLFHNLIKNALEATEELAEPKIEISTDCQTETDKITIKISDNGPGIPQQAANWIFEPYSTDKPKGTGLGLAIVKKIVEEHNGQIELLQNDNQQGTTFVITLSKINADGL